MSKFVRPLVLAFAMVGLVGGAMEAQDRAAAAPQKRDDKKADEKKDVKGTVEYFEAADGWRWRVVIGDKTMATSMKGNEKKEDVLKELEDVKTLITTVKPTEGKPSKKAKGKDKDK